jgi:hypothetical protein
LRVPRAFTDCGDGGCSPPATHLASAGHRPGARDVASSRLSLHCCCSLLWPGPACPWRNAVVGGTAAGWSLWQLHLLL